MKHLFALLLSAGVLLSGCDKESENVTTTPGPKEYTTAISVSEAGAPPYVLPEAQVGSATYQGPTATFTVSGKLLSGTVVRITFEQSSPTATGANVTDVVEVYSEKLGNATQASGRTTRDATRRTVNGSFTSRFADGTTLDGNLKDLVVQ
ncbi:hypothetical protein GCM10027346_06830 [Hymenobacter seoulensis]